MVAALPEVADLGLIVLALVALLILRGSQGIAQMLTAFLRVVPVIGGWIADNLMSHVSDALGAAAGWVGGNLGSLVGFLWTPIHWVIQLFGDVLAMGQEGSQALWRITTVTIPNAIRTAEEYAQSSVGEAIVYAANVGAQAIAFAQGLYWSAVHYAESLVAGAVALAQSLYAQAIAYTQAAVGAVVSWVSSLVAQLSAYVDARVNAVESWVQGVAAGITAYVDARFAAVIDWTGQEIGAVEREAEALYHQATDYAARVAAEAQAAGIAAAGVVAGELETWLRECGRNLCGGLNTLSSVLQALEPLVEGGLLIALAVAAVEDGPGVAHELADTIGGVIDGAAQDVLGQVGLAA